MQQTAKATIDVASHVEGLRSGDSKKVAAHAASLLMLVTTVQSDTSIFAPAVFPLCDYLIAESNQGALPDDASNGEAIADAADATSSTSSAPSPAPAHAGAGQAASASGPALLACSNALAALTAIASASQQLMDSAAESKGLVGARPASQPAGRLGGRLAGWTANGWVAGRLAGRLAGFMSGWLAGCSQLNAKKCNATHLQCNARQ